ncbi:MAG: dipeptidase [Bacteroidales bacterium]
MNYTKFLKLFLITLMVKVLAVSAVFACFTVVVGKDASKDGSVLFGHLEQNGGLRNMSYRYVPGMQHEPGSDVQLRRGGTWPQAEETYAYLWGNNTGVEFADGYFNEHGVAIASDACRTREDSYDELVERGDITDGGIGYQLRRIVAQRAKTAREGVKIAGELLDHFGYASSGRTYIIADAEEAWVLGVARGKNWIAQRVPDDEIVLLPNVHIIGPEADPDDTENVIASDGLVEYAISRGWYDPDSGEPFSFRKAFNRPAREGSFMDENGVDPRQWFSQSLVKGELIDLPAEKQLPFSIKADRKFTVEDVASILRSHGYKEGQEPNLEKSYEIGMPEEGSPHENGGTGNICSGRSQEMVVYQLRNWLPTEVGSVAWRTTAAPCGSVLVPWYAGINKTPKPYYKPWELEDALSLDFHFDPPKGTFDFDPENAFDVFTGLENLIHLDYPDNIEKAREAWDPFEKEQFALQPHIEKVALELLKEDEELARKFLTQYSNSRAMKALEEAKELVNHFKTIHWAH